MKILEKEKKLYPGSYCDKFSYADGRKSIEVIHYNSVAHMCESAEVAKNQDNLNEHPDRDWVWGTEFKGREATKEALSNGEVSRKTLKQIGEYRDSLMNLDAVQDLMRTAETYRRRRVFREEGAELCIDRVMASDPNHWSVMSKGKRQRVVKLAINFAVSSGHSEKQLNRLGALATVTTDMLQRCGFAVEVLGVCTSTNTTNDAASGNKEQGFTVKLKPAEEKLDVSRVACIGIPGLFRAYGFTVMKNYLDGKAHSGLGRANESTPKMKELLGVKHMIEVRWIDGKEKEFLSNVLESVSGEVLEKH